MNIITHFYEKLNESFNNFLINYFNNSNFWNKSSDINNYIEFMNDLDKFNTNLITNVIKAYFEYVDDAFFHSDYRRKYCSSKGFYERTILTLFGEITFKRRYYYDKLKKDRFFFPDLYLNFPKRKYFDPFICAEICNEAASSNYSKTGKIIASKIGNRINNEITISRASCRNIVMNFNISEDKQYEHKRIERLFVMLDEKFVGSQFNNGDDHMIKAAVLFEDTKLVYKVKKKPNSTNRYQLLNSHTLASIDNHLLKDTIDFIYNNYDTDYLKEIIFMGDCANWIKNFPRSHWFKFTPNTDVKFAMDGFHFSQALKHLTTNKYDDVYQELYELVLHNKKDDFIEMCNDFKELNPLRIEVIDEKMNYILTNWNARQLYQNSPYMRCSMESHISHIFADIFTSRPKAYSKKGLRHLLKLRLLKINNININIKEKYFNYLQPQKITTNISYDPTSIKYSDDIIYKDFQCLQVDNYINFFTY